MNAFGFLNGTTSSNYALHYYLSLAGEYRACSTALLQLALVRAKTSNAYFAIR